MTRLRTVLSTLLFSLLLIGCSRLIYTPTPSPLPVDYVPTIIAMTVEAEEQALITPSPVLVVEATQSPATSPTLVEATHTPGLSPTSLTNNATSTASQPPSLTPTQELGPTATTFRRATRTPTITPTPALPVADVQISEPGPMSKISSPLELIANLRSVPSGNYHIEVWIEPLQPGGEARLLFREVKRVISDPVPWMYVDEAIQFELSRTSELGQVRLSMFDQYGRAASINSVDVILLAMGKSEINPTGLLTEPIVIREPIPNHLIQGGTAIVSGEVLPGEGHLLAQLVTLEGVVVGYRDLFVIPSENGSYVPYAVEVPYTVTSPTWALLQVSESGVRIPGVQHLTSVEVLLSP